MSRNSEQINLRLPDGMREQIRAAAQKNGRSMNAEFAARIEESFMQRGFDAWWERIGKPEGFGDVRLLAFAAWMAARQEQ